LTGTALGAFFGCAAAALALPGFSLAPKSSPSGGGQAEVSSVTTGCHPTFDRLVITPKYATPGYDVRYVSQVRRDGSGSVVPLAGTAKLRILIRDARGHTSGGVDLLPAVIDTGCPSLLQVKNAGDFEGLVTLGVGIAHQAGFRVFRLTGPRRVVVDVVH